MHLDFIDSIDRDPEQREIIKQMAMTFKAALRKDSKQRRRRLSYEISDGSDELGNVVQEYLQLINDFIRNSLNEGQVEIVGTEEANLDFEDELVAL